MAKTPTHHPLGEMKEHPAQAVAMARVFLAAEAKHGGIAMKLESVMGVDPSDGVSEEPCPAGIIGLPEEEWTKGNCLECFPEGLAAIARHWNVPMVQIEGIPAAQQTVEVESWENEGGAHDAPQARN